MALLSKIQDFLSNMYLGRNKERKKIKTFGNLCTCAENDQLNILDCKKKKLWYVSISLFSILTSMKDYLFSCQIYKFDMSVRIVDFIFSSLGFKFNFPIVSVGVPDDL